MTNREDAQYKRLHTLETFLTEHSDEFTSNLLFKAEAARIILARADVFDKATKTGMTNSGFSQQKLLDKKAMAETAELYCGIAYVRWENLNKHEHSAQLHIYETDYLELADPASGALAQAGHDLMQNNLTDLSPDYVTQENLDDFQALIDTFWNSTGTSGVQHRIAPGATSAFKASLKDARKIIRNLLLLGRIFKRPKPEFYSKLLIASKLPPIMVRHTGVQGIFIENGQPKADTIISLAGTKKQATTNSDGHFLIQFVKGGTYNLEAKTTTGTLITKLIKIPRGHIVVVDLEG